MDDKELDALEHVLEYLHEEKEDYENDPRDNHIQISLEVLQEYLDRH
jgi:hypothetical protein